MNDWQLFAAIIGIWCMPFGTVLFFAGRSIDRSYQRTIDAVDKAIEAIADARLSLKEPK